MLNEFIRTQMLIGKENLGKLNESSVAIFGVGGVGGFVIEGLARAGVGKLTIVDFDVIDVTNLNRQIIATHNTIGKLKVDVMKERITSINPSAYIVTISEEYNVNSASKISIENFDYVVDAIDMVSSKLELIQRCKEKNVPIISCMGTGNKLDPSMLEISDISKTKVCPLARVIRNGLRERGINKLKVVFSKELPIKPENLDDSSENRRKQIPGSISFVPSVAGLLIASEVIKDIIKKT